MRKKYDFDGFSINLTLSTDEDGYEMWCAILSELPNVAAFGESPTSAVNELQTVWNAYKESCKKHGDHIPKPQKPYVPDGRTAIYFSDDKDC